MNLDLTRSIGIHNLCTMETICYLFRRAIIVHNLDLQSEFLDLIRTTIGNLTFIQLHDIKLQLIQFFKNICPTWTPGKYVGINELFFPLINSTSLKGKFAVQITKTIECHCGMEAQTVYSNSLVISESLLKQTNSVNASLRRTMRRTLELNEKCTFCKSTRLLRGNRNFPQMSLSNYGLELVSGLPDLLLLEFDTGLNNFLTSNFDIEHKVYLDDANVQ